MIHLVGILAAAGELQRFCERQGWRFCLIGGVAVQRWGEPRFTQDVDLTLLTGSARRNDMWRNCSWNLSHAGRTLVNSP